MRFIPEGDSQPNGSSDGFGDNGCAVDERPVRQLNSSPNSLKSKTDFNTVALALFGSFFVVVLAATSSYFRIELNTFQDP